MGLPEATAPEPLCAARESPFLAAGFPLMKTVPLPAATDPWELPQQPSVSLVTLPAVAAGRPLMNTLPEQPELTCPPKVSGL